MRAHLIGVALLKGDVEGQDLQVQREVHAEHVRAGLVFHYGSLYHAQNPS